MPRPGTADMRLQFTCSTNDGLAARQKNLSHMGNIKHAAGRADGLVLGQNARKLDRQLPAVEIHHPSAGAGQGIKQTEFA